MKPAFRKDQALLADIAAARPGGSPHLWWLGQSGFLLIAGGKTILFDPYLSDSLTKKYAQTDRPHTRLTERVIAPKFLTGIDYVTSSHNHTDHLDAETLLPLLAANPKAKVLIPKANRSFVLERLGNNEDRLMEIDAGETLTKDGVQFVGIPAAHNTVERDDQGRCRYLGYVARVGGLTIYHSGDTLWHDWLVPALQPWSVQVALVPINGNKPERRVAGNLRGSEAALLAKQLGVRLAIPHHFDMFSFNTASPDEFEAECLRLRQPFRTLKNGEGLGLEAL